MTLTDAHEIVSGTWHPWLDAPGIATPDEWRSAAQSALDGCDSDLRFYLGQLNGEIELPDEPPRWADCVAAVERWRKAEHTDIQRKEAA